MYGTTLQGRAQQKAAVAEKKSQEFPENIREAIRLADMFSDIMPDEYVVPGTRQVAPDHENDPPSDTQRIVFTRL